MDTIEIIREQVRKGYIVGQWEALGKRGISLTDRMSFLEDVFLCGFQAAQLAAGLTANSPEFVVDAHIELARQEMHAVPKLKGAAKDYQPYAHPRYWAAFILIGDPE